jgi:hypothetical protein
LETLKETLVSLSANRQIISFRFAALGNEGARLPALDFGLPKQKPNTGLFNHPPHTRPTLSIHSPPPHLPPGAPPPSPSRPESRPLPVSLPNLGFCAVGGRAGGVSCAGRQRRLLRGRRVGGRCLLRWRAAAAPARSAAAPAAGGRRAAVPAQLRSSRGALGADLDHTATVDEVSPSADLPCIRPSPSSCEGCRSAQRRLPSGLTAPSSSIF